jgi:hypothetical protein
MDSFIVNLAFILFGCGSAWLGWRSLQRATASANWPYTDGTIVGSSVEYTHNGEHETRRAIIAYAYEVGGTAYGGKRVSFGDGIALVMDRSRQARLAAYPVGRSVRVAYNPTAPAEAVLEPGPNWAVYIGLLAPAALACVGLLNLVRGG